MKSRTRFALVATAAALAIAACGGGSNGAATTSVATVSPVASAASSTSGSTADAGAGSVTGTTADSAAWDSVVAAAKKEGHVTVYTSQNPANMDLLKPAFQAAYPGITMEYVRGVDADMATKVEAEKQTGRGTADVYVTASGGWITGTGTPGNFAVPLTGPAFDNPAYNRAKSITDGKYFLVGAAVLGMGWNTDQLPAGLKSYKDLLNPALDGKIGITKPTSGAYVDFYNFVQKNTSPDFLTQLAALHPRIYPGTLPISQALTSGELAAALVVNPLVAEKASGAPVDWVLPDPAWGARWNGMVLTAAPNPNAAQVLANFMVTQAGQIPLSKGYGSALPGIDGAVADAQKVAVQDPSLQTPDAVATYLKKWESMFE